MQVDRKQTPLRAFAVVDREHERNKLIATCSRYLNCLMNMTEYKKKVLYCVNSIKFDHNASFVDVRGLKRYFDNFVYGVCTWRLKTE